MSIKDRGFASMPLERRQEIASAGGRAAHALGVAHRWTSAEAVLAGRKGGEASRGVKRTRARVDAPAVSTETPIEEILWPRP